MLLYCNVPAAHSSGDYVKLFLQIIKKLQELSITKVLFQPYAVERGGARSHGNDKGGGTINNGYSTNQSAMILLTERVANGYYKTVVCLMNLHVAMVIELVFCCRRTSVMGCYWR